MRRSTRNLAVGLTALANLNLDNVKRKLMEPPPEGKGWSLEQVNEAELWYRRYLELCLRRPEFPVVPNYPIDMFWHQHILDTRAYGKDCDAIFGEMLHHYPYFGLNGDADQRDDAFVETNRVYRELFGEDCTHMNGFAVSKRPLDCMEGAPIGQALASAGQNCNSGGSGTGCGQGCSGGGKRTPDLVAVGQNCNSGGSGTGCGQGCSGGGKLHDFGPVMVPLM